MLKNLVFFILLQAPLLLFAQYQLNGDAIALGDDCFQLTPAQDGTQGSVWFFPTIDLRVSLDISAELHFGCADGNGADGITFSLHTSSAGLGGGGQGQGFHYLWPSLGVEFDNFKNGDESDPSYDHMAIVSQGSVNHDAETNLAGPVKTNPDNENVEDCEYHEIRISWDAFTQTINVYYDCVLRLNYTGNIIGEIFQGDPIVFWGFTAACGASSNKQIACVKNLKIVEPLPDYIMCAGGQIQLEAEGGQSYEWSPIESLNNPYIANPLASPVENTTYQLTITDGCVQFRDSAHIVVIDDLEVFFGFSDSTLCEGETIYLDASTENATYQWSTGATTPDITVSTSGYYVVTVTLEAGGEICVANDAAQVNFISLPAILFSEYNSLCEGESIVLDAGFPNATYLWQDGSTDSIYIVSESGVYTVEVNHHCETKKYTKEITYEQSCTDVYIPNAFSPNYDGTNDHFIILDGGDVVIIKHLRIVDRWGEIVFEAKNFLPNDRTFGWDGKLEGELVLSGVYVYFVELVFRDGSTEVLVGDVAVIR
jgi:gliding motility-associated-like protein